MTVALETEGNARIIVLKGKLDSANAPEAEKLMLGALAGGTGAVVLDMADLDYLSSAGLRVVLMAAKRLKSSGGHFALCSVRPAILEILDIAGFTSILTLCPDRAAALAAVGG